jgi:hypothetical protein
MTFIDDACDSVTVKGTVDVPEFPSTTDASGIDTAGVTAGVGEDELLGEGDVDPLGIGPSSLTIVTRPWESARVAFEGLARFTKKYSSASGFVSPKIVTGIVRVVCPGWKTTFPPPPW